MNSSTENKPFPFYTNLASPLHTKKGGWRGGGCDWATDLLSLQLSWMNLKINFGSLTDAKKWPFEVFPNDFRFTNSLSDISWNSSSVFFLSDEGLFPFTRDVLQGNFRAICFLTSLGLFSCKIASENPQMGYQYNDKSIYPFGGFIVYKYYTIMLHFWSVT